MSRRTVWILGSLLALVGASGLSACTPPPTPANPTHVAMVYAEHGYHYWEPNGTQLQTDVNIQQLPDQPGRPAYYVGTNFQFDNTVVAYLGLQNDVPRDGGTHHQAIFSIFSGDAIVRNVGVGTNGVAGNSASGVEGSPFVSSRMTYDFALGRKYRYQVTRTRGDAVESDFKAEIIDTTTGVSREIGTISIPGLHTIGHTASISTFIENYGAAWLFGAPCPSYSHPITVDVQPAVLDGLASTVFSGLVEPVNFLSAQNVCQNGSATPIAGGGLRLITDK